MFDKLFVLSQYITPQRAVSRLAGRLADSTSAPAMKNRVVSWFIGRYGVNMSEAAESDPTAYPSFNAFLPAPSNPACAVWQKAAMYLSVRSTVPSAN